MANECEVTIQFDMSKLGEEGMKHLFDAERSLRKAGITFDTGGGFGGRDWEWDWSLEGPVTVRFLKFKGEGDNEQKSSN
jgi:hypothetical protein